MSYSPALASAFNRTRLRDEKHVCAPSGMCSMCTGECVGSCEIGLSALRGRDAVYPTTTGNNQIASEKNYPVDFSHFNINGRVFGALGISKEDAAIHKADLSLSYGTRHPVPVRLPFILPALIKLNWRDYFSGAALAGVPAVIGEGAYTKDKSLKLKNGKVTHCPVLKDFLGAYTKYYHGFGQIILQVNTDDDRLGVPEYAIRHCGAKAIEFKFGQSAKGVQPVKRLPSLKAALEAKKAGETVYPDPEDSEVQKKYADGRGLNFRCYGSLPMWDEETLLPRTEYLRNMGAENIYFKTACYDPHDLERILRLAEKAEADLVTFDGAGGGTGYSPCRMMNEWGLPAVTAEKYITDICLKMEAEGLRVPDIAVTGGFSLEDSVFKGLALGAPYVKLIGLCRPAMAAAMSADKIGRLLAEGSLPADLREFGTTEEELFPEIREIRDIFGDGRAQFPTGAVGVYSYLSRVGFGLQHFAALNRKFSLGYIDKTDLIPLTSAARELLSGG